MGKIFYDGTIIAQTIIASKMLCKRNFSPKTRGDKMKRMTFLAVFLSALIVLGLSGNALALKIKFSGSADWITSDGITGSEDQWLRIYDADSALQFEIYHKV